MPTDIEIQETETENQYAQDLYAQQAEQQMASELQEVVEEGKSYRSPSKFKYSVLFTLAVIVDAVDFLELTGIGWFVAKIVSIIGTAIIVLIFFFTGTKQKNAQEYKKKLTDFLENSARNIAHTERMALRLANWGKYTKYVSSFAAEAIGIIAGAINLIPGIDLVPWMTVGVYLSYRDEKNTLNNARETAEAIEEEVATEAEPKT